jgi:hypothetical protein
VHGEDCIHEEIADSLSDIGSCHAALEDHRQAFECHSRALRMRLRLHDPHNHMDIVRSLDDLAMSMLRLDMLESSQKCLEAAMRMLDAMCEKSARPHAAHNFKLKARELRARFQRKF